MSDNPYAQFVQPSPQDVSNGPSAPVTATPQNVESLPVITDDGSSWAQPAANPYADYAPKKVSGAILPLSRSPGEGVRFDPDAGIVGQVKDAFSLPRDVATGNVRLDPNNPNAVARVNSAAALATPGDMVAPEAGSGALMPRGVATPTKEELYQSGGSKIRQANGMGVHLWPQGVSDLADQAANSLVNDNFYEVNAPTTHALLNRLGSPDPAVSFPLAQLDAYRSAFMDNAKDLAGTKDGLASRNVVSILDRFMENPPPEAVLAGPAADAAQLYRAGRGDWAAAERSNKVQGIEYKADVQSANPRGSTYDSSLRRKMQPLLDPSQPSRMYGFTPDEKAGVENIANGTPVRNTLGTVGEWMGGKGHWSSTVPSTIAAVAGAHEYGIPGAMLGVVPPMVGTALRGAESKLANNAFNRLDTSIRQRSPLFQQRLREAGNSIPNSSTQIGATRGAVASSVNQPPDQSQPAYAKGGKVKKPSHEFLVQRLMNLAEKAKREEKKATAPILNMPDDAVTAALAKAQEAI